MKKYLFGGITLALALAFAVPAYAGCYGGYCYQPQQGSTSINNHAFVLNDTLTNANTGFNKATGGMFVGGVVNTGAARSTAEVLTQANYTNVICNTCMPGSKVSLKNNAKVLNFTDTLANTGFNKATGGCLSGGSVTSGAATAGSYVTSVVNTSILGGLPPVTETE